MASVEQSSIETSTPSKVEGALISGCESLRPLLAKYDWNVDTMIAISRAESNCTPGSVGDQAISYMNNGRLEGVSCGLFQIRILGGRPDCEALKDPATNIEWAYKIYSGQGFAAWSVCTSGRVYCG